MIKVESFYWPNTAVAKPQEDAWGSCPQTDGSMIITVADGVTRRGHEADYPDPSPAAQAAKLIVGHVLDNSKFGKLRPHMDTMSALHYKLIWANRKLTGLNQELGFWGDRCDYWVKDLAGCVASVAVVDPTHCSYVYLADSGAAMINKDGGVVLQTPDDMSRVRANLPQGDHKESFIRCRRDHRNKPNVVSSYGVLTGEPIALSYIGGGISLRCRSDVVITYTDGAAGLLKHKRFRNALARKELDIIEQIGAKFREEDGITDEGTIVMAYESD